jgi:ABC-type cobalt transport system substrate-binding protein
MAKKAIFWVILVMVLAFGMTVVGCDNEPPPAGDDDDIDNRPYLRGYVESWGTSLYPVVGETITVLFTLQNQIGTPSWKWYKTQETASSLSNVTNKIFLGSDTTYTVQQGDKGFWIWAEISYSGNRGTLNQRTGSTVIGIPATATVSVSIKAESKVSVGSVGNNHRVTVILTLSDGRWDTNISESTGKQWVTMSGVPSVSSWFGSYGTFRGRELVLIYETRLETTPTINLTATLNTAQLGTMCDNTNVTSTLTAGTTTASVSQWTEGFY